MHTAQFIIEKVAPLFNKKGYVATSMTEITAVVGLTKGAIYSNFENKEELALKAFEANIAFALDPLFSIIASTENSIDKLKAVTAYQKTLFLKLENHGGCPLMRVGADTKFNNPLLFKKAQETLAKLEMGLKRIIERGIKHREITPEVIDQNLEKTILSLIQGSSFLAFTHQDKTMIDTTMDYIDREIIDKISIK